MDIDSKITDLLNYENNRINILKKNGLKFPNKTSYDGNMEKFKELKKLDTKNDINIFDIYDLFDIQKRLCLTSEVKDEGSIYNLLYKKAQMIIDRFNNKSYK